MGVDGLSLARGLSANSEAEAAITLAVAGAAGHVHLLCDASKLEQDKCFQFAPLSLVGTLLTDARAPEALRAQYQETGFSRQ